MLLWALACIHLFKLIFVYSCHMSRSRIARLYGSSIFTFLRNLHNSLHSGWTNLHSKQQCRRGHSSPPLLQHSLFVDFLMMAILTSVKMWYIIVVLISTPQITAMLSIFSWACWPTICPLWRNVCLGFLSIFDWVVCFLKKYWDKWAICIF